MTFSDIHVRPDLIAALAKQKITEPTPIQAVAYPVLLEGKDAYLNAETGTGKTLAYLLPLFCRIDPKLAATQLMIVAPTHELALQIQKQCCDLAVNAGFPAQTLLLIGGTLIDRQIEKLKKKPHVVVGSPGRIRELIQLGKLKAHQVKSLVVDEADRLLVEESLPAFRELLHVLPRDRQLVFVSATQQPESAAIVAALSPGLVMLQTAATPMNPNIEHLGLVCEERDKPDLLRSLLHALQPERAIVFVHRTETAEIVAAKLAYHHIAVAQLHGAFDKSDRKQAMEDFRSGRAAVMIASDVAARGLDIPGVTHIFNLDAPTLSKAYLHRVGRTARAGTSGVAVTLFAEAETSLARRYEEELGIVVQRVRLREGRLLKG
ncbi:MAG TPA: DEAD/DEAH box helicase [Kiritimatiellia bacterium]|nr:DEAD/DEAH box helicase [Kiritimatiellia bacterium]HPS06139.1 DEAD/DEAH box helicase [Kiritimatiellia bacterium]